MLSPEHNAALAGWPRERKRRRRDGAVYAARQQVRRVQATSDAHLLDRGCVVRPGLTKELSNVRPAPCGGDAVSELLVGVRARQVPVPGIASSTGRSPIGRAPGLGPGRFRFESGRSDAVEGPAEGRRRPRSRKPLGRTPVSVRSRPLPPTAARRPLNMGVSWVPSARAGRCAWGCGRAAAAHGRSQGAWAGCLAPRDVACDRRFPRSGRGSQAAAMAQTPSVRVRPRAMRLRRLRAAVRRLSQALLSVVPR
jgi:hypothetical protein